MQRFIVVLLVLGLLVTQHAALPHTHPNARPGHDLRPHTHLPFGEDHDEDEHDADAVDLIVVADVPVQPLASALADPERLTTDDHHDTPISLPVGRVPWWSHPLPVSHSAVPLYLQHQALLR